MTTTLLLIAGKKCDTDSCSAKGGHDWVIDLTN